MEIKNILSKTNRDIVSFDLGQASLKVAYFKSSVKGLKLIDYAFKVNAMEPVGQSEDINFINSFLRKNSLFYPQAYLTVSDPQVVWVKHMALPLLPKEEKIEAIKWQLKRENIFDVDASILDYRSVDEYSEPDGAKKEVVASVLAKKEFIDKCLGMFKDCNISPARISVSSFNYGYILEKVDAASGIVAVFDLGYKNSSLNIYKNKKLSFLRQLAFSSDKLTQSLIGTLVSNKGKVEIGYKEAEELKLTFGIPLDESAVLKENIDAIQIISLMRPFLEGLARELKRSFEYFASNLKGQKPEILYLTGAGANLKNLSSYLSKELGIKVTDLPLEPALDAGPLLEGDKKEAKNQLSNCLGALLGGPDAINLLPHEIKAQKIEFLETVSLRVVSIIAAAILLFSFSVVSFKMQDYKKRLRHAQLYLKTVGNIKTLKQEVDAREAAINEIQKGKVPVYGLLKLISNIIPDSVALNELILDQHKHILFLRGNIPIAVGAADSVLTGFMQKMESSVFFIEAKLISSQKTEAGQQFEIEADLIH